MYVLWNSVDSFQRKNNENFIVTRYTEAWIERKIAQAQNSDRQSSNTRFFIYIYKGPVWETLF